VSTAAHMLGCVLSLSLAAALPGCNKLPRLGWQRMVHQQRGAPYRSSPYLPHGELMQPPPAGTVARNAPRGPRPLVEGLDGNAYTTSLPLPLDRDLLERGHARFDVFCATCHGLTGDGVSVVAHEMSLRKPPSLVDARVRGFPPGRIFRVITDGYGLMPSYAYALEVSDRWAVVAYLHALQRSASTQLSELPPALQRRALGVLR
jgi:mono/diheme cytochrome c family protein